MKAAKKFIDNKLLIGRNEWCRLPELHVPFIKAKIDTGAKTSAIHAFDIERIKLKGKDYANFNMHPIQANETTIVRCKAEIIDARYIMSSNGHKEHRYVISTELIIGEQYMGDIEVTLSNRDPLQFRMLLGREALQRNVLVDPSLACHQIKPSSNMIKVAYDR